MEIEDKKYFTLLSNTSNSCLKCNGDNNLYNLHRNTYLLIRDLLDNKDTIPPVPIPFLSTPEMFEDFANYGTIFEAVIKTPWYKRIFK